MDRSAFLMTTPNVWTWTEVAFKSNLELCVCICVFPGAEHASVTMRTNIQVALSQVDEAQKLSLDADKKLAETKVMEIERMAQYAASLQNNDEEEVPEAYLREDWNKKTQVSENRRKHKKHWYALKQITLHYLYNVLLNVLINA